MRGKWEDCSTCGAVEPEGRSRLACEFDAVHKASKAPASRTHSKRFATYHPRVNKFAKRLECVRLAGAFARPTTRPLSLGCVSGRFMGRGGSMSPCNGAISPLALLRHGRIVQREQSSICGFSQIPQDRKPSYDK